jgi:hypothetical protein
MNRARALAALRGKEEISRLENTEGGRVCRGGIGDCVRACGVWCCRAACLYILKIFEISFGIDCTHKISEDEHPLNIWIANPNPPFV